MQSLIGTKIQLNKRNNGYVFLSFLKSSKQRQMELKKKIMWYAFILIIARNLILQLWHLHDSNQQKDQEPEKINPYDQEK